MHREDEKTIRVPIRWWKKGKTPQGRSLKAQNWALFRKFRKLKTITSEIFEENLKKSRKLVTWRHTKSFKKSKSEPSWENFSSSIMDEDEVRPPARPENVSFKNFCYPKKFNRKIFLLRSHTELGMITVNLIGPAAQFEFLLAWAYCIAKYSGQNLRSTTAQILHFLPWTLAKNLLIITSEKKSEGILLIEVSKSRIN